MPRLFHARAGLALGLSLILFGAVAGCDGEDDKDTDAGIGAPAAEPGQTSIPETEPGDAGADEDGGAADVPVTGAPDEPGTGP
jgi:hypothetical protein